MNLYEIVIKDEALKDLNNAIDWYNEQQHHLGFKFQDQVIAQINSLKTKPLNHSISFDKIRCLLIKKFPFVIHYIVDEFNKKVEIFSIFHTSRNPDILDKRL